MLMMGYKQTPLPPSTPTDIGYKMGHPISKGCIRVQQAG